MRVSRSASSAAVCTAAVSSAWLRPGRAASSSSPRRMARGERSSWLASATNARSVSSARRSRLSRLFMVPARAAISSLVRGTCRTAGSPPRTEIAAA